MFSTIYPSLAKNYEFMVRIYGESSDISMRLSSGFKNVQNNSLA